MCNIGVMPSLANKPYMLERLQRDHNLIRVDGKHVHLVEPTLNRPFIKKAMRHATFSPSPNGGGHAA